MWDLTPHSRQLLWSQRREQWNTDAALGVRMRAGKLDLQLPLWGTSTQSTRGKLSSFLAASPSWLGRRSEQAVDTGLISGACVKSLEDQPPAGWSWVQLTKTIRTEPELQLLLCHRPWFCRRSWPQHPHIMAGELPATFQLCQKHDCFSCCLSSRVWAPPLS